MGLMDKRRELLAEKDARAERDEHPERCWEYKALNLAKVPEAALEMKANQLGEKGWELVAAVEGRAVFKRPRPALGPAGRRRQAR